jgi:hypothetical protein
MTEPEDLDTQRELRAMLAHRIGALTPPRDVYRTVRRRHRRGRRAMVGGTALAASAAVAVPTLVLRDQDRPAPVATAAPTSAVYCPGPAGPRHGPVTVPALPAQTGVRGSLADDPAAVRAILVEGWKALADPSWPPHGDRTALRPATARVLIAHRADDRVFGVVRVGDSAGRTSDAFVTGARLADLNGWAQSYGVTGAEDLPRPYVYELEACGVPYTLVDGGPGATAELAWVTSVRPDGQVVEDRAGFPAVDGIAVLPQPDPDQVSRLIVRRGGMVLVSSLSGASATAFDRGWEFGAARERAVRTAPGNADRRALDRALDTSSAPWIGGRKSDPRIVWGGRASTGRSAVVATVAFDGGARLAWISAIGADFTSSQLCLGGIVPAGRLDRTVFSCRPERTGSLVVAAVRGVRAELVRPGGPPTSVPLSAGGAIVENAGLVRTVRVFDAAGALVGEVAPGGGLIPLPGT